MCVRSLKIGWWVKMRARADAFSTLPSPADTLPAPALAALLSNERGAYQRPSPDPQELRARETAAGRAWRELVAAKGPENAAFKQRMKQSLALLEGASAVEEAKKKKKKKKKKKTK